jgi:drug/metabolite transporter (DMT)-like permease
MGPGPAYRSAMTADRERVALAAFLTTSVLAGGNAVSIRFSNRELAPLWGAGLRFSLAAALLGGHDRAQPQAPERTGPTSALLYGLLNFGAGLALAYYALVRLHAGFAQMLLALVPLVTLLLAVAQRQERLHLAAVVGTLLAVAGVAILSRAPLRESVPLLSVLATLGSAVCIAQAAVLVRRFPPVHPVTMNAVAMAIAAVVLVAASVLVGEPHVLPQRAVTWVALGFAVVVGSIVVFVLYVIVLRYWAASRAAYGFVLTPFITVMLSAWLDDEPIHVGLILGGLLVLAGVYVGALRPSQVPAAPPPA